MSVPTEVSFLHKSEPTTLERDPRGRPTGRPAPWSARLFIDERTATRQRESTSDAGSFVTATASLAAGVRHLLVSSATVTVLAPMERTTPQDWQRILATALIASCTSPGPCPA